LALSGSLSSTSAGFGILGKGRRFPLAVLGIAETPPPSTVYSTVLGLLPLSEVHSWLLLPGHVSSVLPFSNLSLFLVRWAYQFPVIITAPAFGRFCRIWCSHVGLRLGCGATEQAPELIRIDALLPGGSIPVAKVSYRGRSCRGSSASVVHSVSGKWTPFLMMALAERPHRFGQLRRLLPDISQRMLTQTLFDLQRDGYVHREVLPTDPPSVEYSLTSLGRSLFSEMQRLLLWAEANHASVDTARSAFDLERREG
jgi:DNA-binding HxlR family transcriptional regulator